MKDFGQFREELKARITGEVRFDDVSRALYATDASVYQILPLGVAIPRCKADVLEIVRLCGRHGVPLTMRGGGTSQAGQAIGEGLQVDTSKYYNRVLEVKPAERWARVEPGIVLDELNAQLKAHGLRFAPDISTASRATIGGMIANNSSGARSVLYGKTIDHVLELEVCLADGTVSTWGPVSGPELHELSEAKTLEGEIYRTVQRVAHENAEEVRARFPKVMRRVMGYNLDEFADPTRPVDLTKLVVGSEGTLAVVLEAKLKLVPLPKAKAVVAGHFETLLEALAATPFILRHKPSAIEVMDKAILDNTRTSPLLEAKRSTFIKGDPGALLCIEFYADRDEDLPPRMKAVEDDLRARGMGYHFHHATTLPGQAAIWGLREAALGLSMAVKEDAKSVSFVEDTAVDPAHLRDYIERFLQIIRKHGTTAGIYAHASVGCLHVRPVVNLKTAEGVKKFEAIANDVADLVLEYGGALSGEHGDGIVRGCFTRKMLGDRIYEALREIKRACDPQGILNPGKVIDTPPLTANFRYGAGYQTPNPKTYFDFSDYGGWGGAVDMCSGLGACRKKLDGTMCPSYMATVEEQDVTRGRANVLRLAMTGKLGEAGITQQGVYDTLDLCLECRACKAECPVGVDMARFKSEFLAAYWEKHGTPLAVRMAGHVHDIAQLGSKVPALANWAANLAITKKLAGMHPERSAPRLADRTLHQWWSTRPGNGATAKILLFGDTFTNFYGPEVGIAAVEVLEAAGIPVAPAGNGCCGRPLISKGLLAQARERAAENAVRLFPAAQSGAKFLFCEPSCLSAVKEDAPSLLKGELREKAEAVARASVLWEEFLEAEVRAGRAKLELRQGPPVIQVHGHCHQKAMGLLPAMVSLLGRIPGSKVVDLDAGCCGMAGSFGYAEEHFEVSKKIANRRLIPAIAKAPEGAVVAAPGFSCRHQVADFAGMDAMHPAMLLRSLLA